MMIHSTTSTSVAGFSWPDSYLGISWARPWPTLGKNGVGIVLKSGSILPRWWREHRKKSINHSHLHKDVHVQSFQHVHLLHFECQELGLVMFLQMIPTRLWRALTNLHGRSTGFSCTLKHDVALWLHHVLFFVTNSHERVWSVYHTLEMTSLPVTSVCVFFADTFTDTFTTSSYLVYYTIYIVYYESRKWELKTRPTYECRCDERLKTKQRTLHVSYTLGLYIFLFTMNQERQR